MKPYEKPKLIALSLSGNEKLCGFCSDADKVLLKETQLNAYLDYMYGNMDGSLTKDEFDAAHIFGTSDSECGVKVSGYEAFCKYSAADTTYTVAWS